MKLTESEYKFAEKHILMLEKDSKMWKWIRWVILLASITVFSFSTYGYLKLKDFNETYPSLFELPADNINGKMVQLYVEGRLNGLRIELVFYYRIMLMTILSTFVLVYCLASWKKGIKSGLTAKILRQILSDHTVTSNEK